jgi:hypothetical protein
MRTLLHLLMACTRRVPRCGVSIVLGISAFNLFNNLSVIKSAAWSDSHPRLHQVEQRSPY